jgi:hypothetical protein
MYAYDRKPDDLTGTQHDMQSVDRALAELWWISDRVTADLRDDFAAARQVVAGWEPEPMPEGWAG